MELSKTIIFLTGAGERGGSEIAILSILRSINREDCTPILCSLLDYRHNIADDVGTLGIEVVRCHAGRLRRMDHLLAAALHVAALARAREAGVIFANSLYVHCVARVAAFLAGVPCACYVMEFVSPGAFSGGAAVSGALFLGADLFLGDSLAVTDSLRARLKGRCPCETLYHGVDIDEFRPGRSHSNVREELGIPEAVPVIGMIGRIQKWKGQDVFLRAAQIVARERADIRFLVVGGCRGGPDLPFHRAVRQLAAVDAVQGKIVFTGFRRDIPAVISACDVIVHASVEPEPFGLVVAEGMAMAKPVIATNAGGPAEIIRHGVDGWLVEPGNHREMADAMRHLLDSDLLRAELGLRARRSAVRRFSSTLTADRLLQLLGCL